MSSSDDEAERDLQADGGDRVIFSAVWKNKKLGVAIFDESTGRLKCAETTEDGAGEWSVLQLFKYHSSPNLLITPARGEEDFIRACSEPLSDSAMDVDTDVLPTASFAYPACVARVGNITLPDMRADISQLQRAQYVSSIIDFEQEAMIRAIGGLLEWLAKHNIINSLMDEGVREHHSL